MKTIYVPSAEDSREARGSVQASIYPRVPSRIPPGTLQSGSYRVRYATSLDDLRAVQRLRYEVFNLELGEGLQSAHATGLDADEHDPCCHHLIVSEVGTDRVIGTYRMTCRELLGAQDWYSEGEFELARMPRGVLDEAVEVGRACVHAEHRNGAVLQLLWKGVARYLDHNEKRFLFGCCSVPSLDLEVVANVSLQLARERAFHESIHVSARSRALMGGPGPVALLEQVELPALFASYLRLGARVCSGPAADHEFGVTDYLVLLDVLDVPAPIMARLGRSRGWHQAA